MDALHIPPWDSGSGPFEEYPAAASTEATNGAKKAAKSDKTLQKEQERLHAMINSVVRLSSPAEDPAGMRVEYNSTALDLMCQCSRLPI